MSLQETYKETTGNNPKSESSNHYPYLCGTGNYSNDYVKWLEDKVLNQYVIKSVCTACSGSGNYCGGDCGACDGTGFETDN